MNAINVALITILWIVVVAAAVLLIFGSWKAFLAIWEDLNDMLSWHDYWKQKYEKRLQKYLEKNGIDDKRYFGSDE